MSRRDEQLEQFISREDARPARQKTEPRPWKAPATLLAFVLAGLASWPWIALTALVAFLLAALAFLVTSSVHEWLTFVGLNLGLWSALFLLWLVMKRRGG